MNWFRRLLDEINNNDPAGLVPAVAESKSGPMMEPTFAGEGQSLGAASSVLPSLTTIDPRPVRNLVDGVNALAEYYRYVEAEAYDRGLKTMREHRDFRDQLLLIADAVLQYEHDEGACDEIQRALEKERLAFTAGAPETTNVAEEARSRDRSGYSLLRLAAPLSFDSLKEAYRKAALTHHPDVGGDNETMSKVNDAYELFSAILRRQAAQENLSDQLPTRDSVAKFFEEVRYTRFAALVDDLNADAAFEAYKKLSLPEVELQFRSWEKVSRLCELLAACSRADDAKVVLHDLGTLVEDGEARDLILKPIYRKTSEACCDPKNIKFVPNHKRQADGLMRSGIIDKKRYDAIIKRAGDTVAKISEDEDAFEKFAKSYPFLRLSIDPPITQLPNGLIPGPDYYARVEKLTEAQKAEYAMAFWGGAVELATKYLAVRMDALLRSAFLGSSETGTILAELNALNGAPGMKTGLRALCKEAIIIVSFLASLTPVARARRIDALLHLDSDPSAPLTVTVSISRQGLGGPLVLPKPIMMNHSYSTFAMGPIERIERYIRTGSELTAAEQGERKKGWEATRAFYDSDIYKRAREATWKERDPEQIISAVSTLCDAMYDRANKTLDRSLEIGYWTDKLTIALVKLKRFDEALKWIKRFDDTPNAIRGRDSNSVLDSLRKRKARCQAALGN